MPMEHQNSKLFSTMIALSESPDRYPSLVVIRSQHNDIDAPLPDLGGRRRQFLPARAPSISAHLLRTSPQESGPLQGHIITASLIRTA